MERVQQPTFARTREGYPKLGGRTFLRPSSLAKTLDDPEQLHKWQMRMAVLGVAHTPKLVSSLSQLTIEDKDNVNALVEEALTQTGAGDAAELGTRIHEATEVLDCGEETHTIDPDIVADASSYQAAVEGLGMTPVAAECFVVNTQLRSAGTFDRLMKHRAGYFITDIKTGKSPDPEYAARYNSVAWGIQLAIYAHASPWVFTDNQFNTPGCTLPPPEDAGGKIGEWEDWGFATPNQQYGVVWYIPRGTATCYPITIDLVAGWEAALIAAQIYQYRKTSFATTIRSGFTPRG